MAPALLGQGLGQDLSDATLVPSCHPQGKYSKRKGRFKRSDGSTSSDTTSNSFVRQVKGRLGLKAGGGWLVEASISELAFLQAPFPMSFVPCLEPSQPPDTLRPLQDVLSAAPTASAPTPASPSSSQPLPPACLPACVISFRDSLAGLLLARFGLSPTPPAGCLLPCPPPESVTGWSGGRC